MPSDPSEILTMKSALARLDGYFEHWLGRKPTDGEQLAFGFGLQLAGELVNTLTGVGDVGEGGDDPDDV